MSLRVPGLRGAGLRGAGLILAALLTLLGGGCAPPEPPAATGLHWFIPDGFRADPTTFNVFQWAEEGKMPHLQALMKRGSYGYSIPAFPSHTPANFATLLTGSNPRVHGVADGPMHVDGHPLDRPAVSGFSSTARKVPAIWSLMEDAGKSVFLLSVPGSTPPELGPGGVTVRGRWGGWGPELPPVIFESASADRQRALARSARLFLVGEELTRFISASSASSASSAASWPSAPPSERPPLEVDLTDGGAPLFGLLIDPPGDGVVGYDRVALSRDRATVLATLRAGEWSRWLPATARWKGVDVATNQRVEVIRVGADGFFRIRVLFDGLNRLTTDPPEVSDALRTDVGPMVDFVDSYPAQLVYYPEDKAAFLSEAQQSLQWHGAAVDAVYTRYKPDVFVHCIYTPNQMLTSRWWMGFLDPTSRHYGEVGDTERAALWDEVMTMYTAIDDAIGRAVADTGPDTLIVLSSDHGAIPLNRSVRLNNVFAERGWLTATTDPTTGAPVVDWARSKVVFLNAYHVYIAPDGLGGDWHRASGPAYEALRSEVIAALQSLRDGDDAPVDRITHWEDADTDLDLPEARVGDLVVSNRAGFGWTEELTPDRVVFGDPKVTGYKQAVSPDKTPGLWTPFVVVGPGIRAGHRIQDPIRAIDQLPTILRAMGQPIPATVEGHAVAEIFEAP